MPAVPPKKASVILKLLDDANEELHAIKLEVAQSKLATPLQTYVERFARHYNRRCAPDDRVDAAALAAADAEGELDAAVPVGNLVDAQKTLRVVLRKAVVEEAAPVEDATAGDEAIASLNFEPSATFTGSKPGKAFKRGYLGQGYYTDMEQSDDAFEPSATYTGPRPGRVFTTRRSGTGYYLDAPPLEYDGALVIRQFTPPPPNGRIYSKNEFDQLRETAPPETTLCLFFEDGDEPEKLQDAFGAMALRFWPRAILLRAGLRTDLAKACDVRATAFVFFRGGKAVDKCSDEMALQVKLAKATRVAKRREAWGAGLLARD